MKIIDIHNNCINNIKDLKKFVGAFKKLEKLDLKDNYIDFDVKENQNIRDDIEKNFKNITLLI